MRLSLKEPLVSAGSHEHRQWVYFISLFLREWLATFCQLLLVSRLGGDVLFAGMMVTLYINIVFRRPLVNPFVLTLACLSAGDWKKANVAGYPNFNRAQTKRWQLAFFWLWLLTAQLLGAAAAACMRAQNSHLLGDEFIRNAAGGTGQLYLRVGPESHCWDVDAKTEIPIRNTALLKRGWCEVSVQWRWWFFEDLGAALFLIVGYVHIWKWLRWDDMQLGNPNDQDERYWGKIIAFSLASAVLALMTVIAFPTANAGWHTSLYVYVLQTLRTDLYITSLNLSEPLVRATGGICGCVMAVLYERMLAWMELEHTGWQADAADCLHMLLYLSPARPKPRN